MCMLKKKIKITWYFLTSPLKTLKEVAGCNELTEKAFLNTTINQWVRSNTNNCVHLRNNERHASVH